MNRNAVRNENGQRKPQRVGRRAGIGKGWLFAAMLAFVALSVLPSTAKAAVGDISTVAGTGPAKVGGFSGDGGPATSANLNHPRGVVVDAAGSLFIADALNHRVRKVAAGSGVITTVAGIGIQGIAGDGGLATDARLDAPKSVAVDAQGNLFIVDQENHRVRKVAGDTKIITRVAGVEGIGGTPPLLRRRGAGHQRQS